MAGKRPTSEEIVAKLAAGRSAEFAGQDSCRGSSGDRGDGVTYYRLRKEYGGLKGDQVKRLKELETENTRLRRAVSDLTLDKLILTEAAKGNF